MDANINDALRSERAERLFCSGRPRRKRWCQVTLPVGLAALLFVAAPALAQEDIEDARRLIQESRVDELKARTDVDALNSQFEAIDDALRAADELVIIGAARVAAAEAQLESLRREIAHTEVTLGWAEYDLAFLNSQVSEMALREYVGASDSSTFLSGADPNESLRRYAVLEVVQGTSADIAARARAWAAKNEALREQLEGRAEEAIGLEERLHAELAELESSRDRQRRARDALEATRRDWQERVDEFEREQMRLDGYIRAEQRKVDALRAVDSQRSSEGYVWPTGGGIGSYFGMRIHPVLGYRRLHGGIDIGGYMGQPIYAAKEGRVILASVKGGYGNTIVLDHGNGYATLYGHQSSFMVGVGDQVETGQHIGNIGSTGLSTGPHLHFEVRMNGKVTDPLPYLPSRHGD